MFAGFRIDSMLGQGGMGTVYLAQHPRLPRSVALKLLNREVSGDPEVARRFQREADVVARLEHPGIIDILDRGVDQGHLWIAMQYIRGTDAAHWDSRKRPAHTVVRLLGGTASALDFAHSQGVLHRDVKPANILIADAVAGHEARSVLTDFGIARLTGRANTKLTATGTFTATLAYGSPEQLSGEPVDHRSDQYSLACTLFAMLTGEAPYDATNPGQVVMGHVVRPVPRLTERRPDLPPTVDAVLAKGLAKRRDDRFASCTEFITAMADALHGRPVAGPVPRSAPTLPRSAPDRPIASPPAPEPLPATAQPARRAAPVRPGPPVGAPPAAAHSSSRFPAKVAGGLSALIGFSYLWTGLWLLVEGVTPLHPPDPVWIPERVWIPAHVANGAIFGTTLPYEILLGVSLLLMLVLGGISLIGGLCLIGGLRIGRTATLTGIGLAVAGIGAGAAAGYFGMATGMFRPPITSAEVTLLLVNAVVLLVALTCTLWRGSSSGHRRSAVVAR